MAGKNLQAALERSRGAAPVVTLAPAPSAPLATPKNAETPAKSPSRVGKIHIGAYLAPDFKKSLMLVRAQTGQDVQTLLAQALNDLFRAHNVPVVDHD